MNINNHKDRVQLAEDTLKICETGTYQSSGGRTVRIGEELAQCLENTQHYTPEQLENVFVDKSGEYNTSIEVTGETTLQAAQRLIAENVSSPVLALIFASAKNTGGG